MKRLLLAAVLAGLLALPVAGASAGRGTVDPDENNCFQFNGRTVCVQPRP